VVCGGGGGGGGVVVGAAGGALDVPGAGAGLGVAGAGVGDGGGAGGGVQAGGAGGGVQAGGPWGQLPGGGPQVPGGPQLPGPQLPWGGSATAAVMLEAMSAAGLLRPPESTVGIYSQPKGGRHPSSSELHLGGRSEPWRVYESRDIQHGRRRDTGTVEISEAPEPSSHQRRGG